MTRWVVPALAGAATAVSVLTGCSGDRPQQPTPDLTAEVLQYRSDEADRMIEVKVRNAGDVPVTVTQVEVEVPAFDGPGPVEKSSQVRPGLAVDLRLPYGDPECEQEVDPDGDVVAELVVDGAPLRLAAASGGKVLGRIHQRECAVAQALERVPLTWRLDWRSAGEGEDLVVDGVLSIGPVTGDQPVRVTDLTGTTLFTTTVPAGTFPLSLPPGESREVPVRFAPQRCDPHAVAESKRGYAFGVRVLTDPAVPDDADGALVTVVPDEAGQDVLLDALLQACGLG